MTRFLFLCIVLLPLTLPAQVYKDSMLNKRLVDLQNSKIAMENGLKTIEKQIELTKLSQIAYTLQKIGLPALEKNETLIKHSALMLVYDEQHEQAKWVAHIISPDIVSGSVFRTNDFRVDSLIKTGSAIEKDYFLKTLLPDSTYEYDGFGYDRGHLAPSADFRWSQKALSESYFYSNMSPQLPEFNREIWAELENALRAYIYNHPESELMVVTGPVLADDLPKLERAVNSLSIPKTFWKVAIDLKEQQGIGFILPHEAHEGSLAPFAVSIDEVEKISGIDFFPALEDTVEDLLEKKCDKKIWLPDIASGNSEPVNPTTLPPNHFNTVQAGRYMNSNEEIFVVGKVVSARTSRAGNILINLDKQFPNQIFTVFIRKQFIPNFSYDPVSYLQDKLVVLKGKIVNLGGTAAIFIEDQNHLSLYEE
ncbi:MAG: DNA/RNA non-specific endonuclease [Bacteroidota bacterium]